MNEKFAEHLTKYLSKDEIKKLISSFSVNEKKALLLNTEKMSENTLFSLFPNIEKHPIVPNGYLYDKNEYDLGKKVYHELGAYYIQEPSAMLVANILNANSNDIVLDLCSAPGGKTIQTAFKMQNKGMIIANDLSKSRANILLSNIERMGIKNSVVTSLDFTNYYKYFTNYFDKIILDAPCSGSGMFRKSSEMLNDWTYEKVVKNSIIQKELILMCYAMLKEGGTLIYSTCSYSYEEDEEIIDYLLNKTDAYLDSIPPFDGDYRSKQYPETVHLFPHLFGGEGHYIALIRKPGIISSNKFNEEIIKRQMFTKSGIVEENTFVLPHSLPKDFIENTLRPGLLKQTSTKDKIIPSHHYSHVSNSLNSIELTKDELVKYFRGETLNKKYPNGYYFVSYLGMNAGVVHCVQETLKNLYPKGLRFNTTIDKGF